MLELNVNASTHRYNIHIGNDLRFHVKEFLTNTYSSVLIITDDTIAPLYLQDVIANFPKDSTPVYDVVIKSGEASKSIKTYYDLQTAAMEFGLDRQSLIIALGGGVVGDIAGFVAATFMRGIDYIQMPTTILAHDSSVGGKVAINHELGKNMIGNFYSPQAVIYDVTTLQTLPEHEIRSGYAELIKEAFISDAAFLNVLLNVSLDTLNPEQLKNHLYQGIKIKAHIVEEDEKESYLRKFLNLGHTLAHALEADLGYGKITHGEAVAIGLLFALRVSEHVYNIKLPYSKLKQWLIRNHYPLFFDSDIENIIQFMKSDKKSHKQTIQMVLMEKIASLRLKDFEDNDLREQLLLFKKELGTT